MLGDSLYDTYNNILYNNSVQAHTTFLLFGHHSRLFSRLKDEITGKPNKMFSLLSSIELLKVLIRL